MFPHTVTLTETQARLTVACAMCETPIVVVVSPAAYRAYRAGVHVQHAFPDLSPALRELLISGTCGDCFTRLFGPAPEADEEARSS